MQKKLGFKIDRAQLLPVVIENLTDNTEQSFNSIAGTRYPAEIVEFFNQLSVFLRKNTSQRKEVLHFQHSQVGQNDNLSFS